MKKNHHHLIQRSFLILISFFSFYQSSPINAEECKYGVETLDESGLGSVQYSLLSVEDFQKYNGKEWVLLDGKTNIADTDLPKSVDKLPDARGVFLRGKNYDRSTETGNPDGDKDIGTGQSDTLQNHTHTVTYGEYTNGFGFPDRAGREVLGPAKETNGVHSGRVSSETRPRNITVNTFVKIKLKCRDAYTFAKITQNEKSIKELEEYKKQSRCDKCLDLPENNEEDVNQKLTCFYSEIQEYLKNKKKWTQECLAINVSNTKRMLDDYSKYPFSYEDKNAKSISAELDHLFPWFNPYSTK